MVRCLEWLKELIKEWRIFNKNRRKWVREGIDLCEAEIVDLYYLENFQIMSDRARNILLHVLISRNPSMGEY